jgi:uncharacterized protein YyaL (SSP411 family)
VLLRLGRIWGDDGLERRAASAIGLAHDALQVAPSSFGWMLVALQQQLAPHREVAIVGAPADAVARAALARAEVTDVVAFGPAEDVPLLAGRSQVDGLPTVYRCERFVCSLPVTDPASV